VAARIRRLRSRQQSAHRRAGSPAQRPQRRHQDRRPRPWAYTADNDWALGQLVDTVSHSQFWPNTAIFVTEDDAQDGPDHIDAHRTLAEVISPYTHTGRVDSTFYSTASMLRTIELIVGLRPLTRFDAYATPMPAAFTNKPDLTPYTALQPTQNMQEVNPVNAPFAAQSQNQDLTKEDQINMHQFNEATWASIKGAIIPMPAPQHDVFPAPAGEQATTTPTQPGATVQGRPLATTTVINPRSPSRPSLGPPPRCQLCEPAHFCHPSAVLAREANLVTFQR
jgi:hypothetical protein